MAGSFSDCMLSKSCHESILQLGESEIKVLENVKLYLSKQVHITEQYINAMSRLHQTSSVLRSEVKMANPFSKIWDVFYAENNNVTSVLGQVSQTFHSSIIRRVEKLLSYCKEVHKSYKSQRFRFDSEFKTTCDEKTRLENLYRQHAIEVKSLAQKIEGQKKAVDKSKEEKFYKSSLKLYQNHNEYVLALSVANIHQHHYENSLVPNLLTSLQAIKSDLVLEWKEICGDMVGQIKAFSEQNLKLFEDVHQILDLVKNDNPYHDFLQEKGEMFVRHADYNFDTTLLDICKTELVPNEISLFDLTHEQLKTKISLLEQSLTDVKLKLNEKSTDYQTVKESLQQLKETSHCYQSIFHDQMNCANSSRELKELSCQHEKTAAQHSLISNTLSLLNGNPPKTFTSPLITNSDSPFGSPTTRKSNRTMERFKNINLPHMPKIHFKRSSESGNDLPDNGSGGVAPLHAGYSNHKTSLPSRPLPKPPEGSDSSESEGDNQDYDEPVEKPLDKELWYHSTIARADCEALLVNNGDFMVRESARAPGQYVLSVLWDKPCHFKLIQDEQNHFKLEGESFPTIRHLIEYHQKQQCSLTRKTNAKLLKAILRSSTLTKSRVLLHSNIVVKDKLGRGHFGDVMKGYLKDTKQHVAIKTCRDNVLEAMKEKFLQEAEILGQYDHPNIVKLIGVALDSKNPVYIVMELMEGGDFLKYLRNSNCDISIKQLTQFTIDAACGMKYLESMGCIHRDLAARNCLLDKQKVLKISDFGMSRETDLYECSNMREIPVKWTAPEALNYSKYTSQSDVWSFGVLLWETFSYGNTPYPGMNNKVTREKVDNGYRMPPPSGTPAAIYQLMMDCWNISPGERPRFNELQQRLRNLKE